MQMLHIHVCVHKDGVIVVYVLACVIICVAFASASSMFIMKVNVGSYCLLPAR